MALDIYGGLNPNEVPAYTMKDAAHHVGIPVSTLRSWVKGIYYSKRGWNKFERIVELPEESGSMLSFVNLVEIHTLTAIRRQYGIEHSKIRTAVRTLKEKFQSKHPLADFKFQTDHVDLFVEELNEYHNLSSDQLPLQEVIRIALSRIDRDQFGRPVGFYPFMMLLPPSDIETAREETKPVSISPLISFGKPVLAKTAIRTRMIADRHRSGASIQYLAEDYNINDQSIKEAIRFEEDRRILVA